MQMAINNILYDSSYRVDTDGPVPIDAEENGVILESLRYPLTEPDYHLLLLTVPPTASDDDYSIDLFMRVRAFVDTTIKNYK